MAYQASLPIYLLKDVDIDTVGDSVNILNSGPKTVIVTGTFGSGTITLEISLDGITWTVLQKEDGTDFTITGSTQFSLTWLNVGLFLRASLAGSSGASGINVAI